MRLKSLFALLLLSALMVSCASNKNNQNSGDTSSDQPAVQQPISVGSIHLRLEVEEADSGNQQFSAKVIEVLGYGAGTQPLSKGDILQLRITETLEKEHQLSEKKTGWAFEAEITKPRQMDGAETPALWNILEIK